MRRVTAPRAVDALREMVVREKDPFARSKAIWALGGIGPAACSALPTLIPLVRNPNPDIRADAVAAQLRAVGDTLAGKASTFWDFPRTTQSTEVRAIRVECGNAPRHPTPRFRR